jgi:hypothetical protein
VYSGRLPYERRGLRALAWSVLGAGLLQFAALCAPEPPPSHRYRDAGRRGPPDLCESIVQWQVTHLLTNPESQDVIFFGDSSCLMGVVPEVVGRESGLRGWNFGTLGVLTTDGHADLLDLYLQGHATPGVAVYHVTLYPLLLTDKKAEEIGYWLPYREWLARERGEEPGPLARLPSHRLCRCCRAWVERRFVRDAERERFLDMPRGPYVSDREMAATLWRNRGYFPEQSWTMPTDGLVKAHQDYANPKLAPDCHRGLKRTFALAQGKGLDLVVLIMPLPEAFRCPQTDACLQQLEQDLRELAADCPRVSFREQAPRYLPNEFYANLNHLRPPAAVRYSEDLGRWLRGRQRAPGVSR